MKRTAVFLAITALAGCGEFDSTLNPRAQSTSVVAPLPEGIVHPVPRPDGLGDGRVVDRPEAGSGSLGITVASLGTAAEPGLWLKTPLVAKTRPGKVTYQGKSVAVRLIPIEGQSGSGSRMSLAAMQSLAIPLTELAEVQVSAD